MLDDRLNVSWWCSREPSRRPSFSLDAEVGACVFICLVKSIAIHLFFGPLNFVDLRDPARTKYRHDDFARFRSSRVGPGQAREAKLIYNKRVESEMRGARDCWYFFILYVYRINQPSFRKVWSSTVVESRHYASTRKCFSRLLLWWRTSREDRFVNERVAQRMREREGGRERESVCGGVYVWVRVCVCMDTAKWTE